MASSPLLPAVLGVDPGSVTVVLFSQPDCGFCEEARTHYLSPLIASRPRRVVVAEVQTTGSRQVRGPEGKTLPEADFARLHDVRYAPTVMFLGPQGKVLAPRIVGLSRDYFGAYLEAGIATALKASARSGS